MVSEVDLRVSEVHLAFGQGKNPELPNMKGDQ